MSMPKRIAMVAAYALEYIGVPGDEDMGPEGTMVCREYGAQSLTHISFDHSQPFC